MLPAPLLPHQTARTATKGQVLFTHGDEAQHLWAVTQGWVKIARTSPEGRETVLGLCTTGDTFGEASLIRDALYPYSAEAVTDVQLVSVSRSALYSVLQQEPDLAVTLLERLHERMRQHQRLLDQLQSLSAAQRVGCFLLQLGDRSAERTAQHLTLPLDKHLLAASLSMKPETFSRALQQLREIGVETRGEEIAIASIPVLQEYVCGACSEAGMCE